MGSMTLEIEGWRKETESAKPEPLEHIQFTVDGDCHTALEEAEEELQRTGAAEKFIDVDPDSVELKITPDCGPVTQCQLRVYLKRSDERGHFHFVARGADDNSLIYSNAVLIESLLE